MNIAKLANQHIAGQWRSGTGEKVLIDRNPFNGEVLGEFAVATAADIDEAYRASAEAQVAWAETNAYAKRTVFENAARIVGERFGEITELIIAEVGGTALKAGFEIGLVIDALRRRPRSRCASRA